MESNLLWQKLLNIADTGPNQIKLQKNPPFNKAFKPPLIPGSEMMFSASPKRGSWTKYVMKVRQNTLLDW